jgi:hypothetical protein
MWRRKANRKRDRKIAQQEAEAIGTIVTLPSPRWAILLDEHGRERPDPEIEPLTVADELIAMD